MTSILSGRATWNDKILDYEIETHLEKRVEVWINILKR